MIPPLHSQEEEEEHFFDFDYGVEETDSASVGWANQSIQTLWMWYYDSFHLVLHQQSLGELYLRVEQRTDPFLPNKRMCAEAELRK